MPRLLGSGTAKHENKLVRRKGLFSHENFYLREVNSSLGRQEMSLFLQGITYGLYIGAIIRLFILMNQEINDHFLSKSVKFLETIKGYLPKNIFQHDIEKS
jgi:hypothetical protein